MNRHSRAIFEAYLARAAYHRWCAAKRFPIVARFRSFGYLSDEVDREAVARGHKAEARAYLDAARRVRLS